MAWHTSLWGLVSNEHSRAGHLKGCGTATGEDEEADDDKPRQKSGKTLSKVLAKRFGRLRPPPGGPKSLPQHLNFILRNVKSLREKARKTNDAKTKQGLVVHAKGLEEGHHAMKEYHRLQGGGDVYLLEWVQAAMAAWPWPGH